MTASHTKKKLSDFFSIDFCGIIRKNLFFKILFLACSINFLSMWIVFLIAFNSSFGPAERMMHHENKRLKNLNQLMHLYATPLIDKWIIGGKSASISYADKLDKFIDFKPFVFNSKGHPLTNREIPQELQGKLERFKKENNSLMEELTDNGIYVIFKITGADGKTYTAAGIHGAPKHFTFLPHDINMRVISSIIMLSILSFFLARHITEPISKLRKATREIADGNFGVRVNDALGKRQDVIGKLGFDFDQMTMQIQTLLKDREQLLRDISHELRSPLARLTIALEMSINKSSEEVIPNLKRIGIEAERLNTLIGEILILNRLESGTNLRVCKETDLAGLIRQIGKDANFEAQKRNVSVIIDTPPVIYVDAYPEMLHRAIENIVRNAIRYTKEGTAVNMSVETKSDFIYVTITDNGSGVPFKSLTHLFKPFYRVEGDRGRKTGGRGVGLAIAYRAIKLHDGDIKAENSKDGGLIMTITIPQKKWHPS